MVCKETALLGGHSGALLLSVMALTAWLGCGPGPTVEENSQRITALQEQVTELSQHVWTQLAHATSTKVAYVRVAGPSMGSCENQAFLCGRRVSVLTDPVVICYGGADCANTVTWRVVGEARCSGDVLTMAKKEASRDCFPEQKYVIDYSKSAQASDPPKMDCDPDSIGTSNALWEYSVTLTNPECSGDVDSVDPLVIIDPGLH